MFKLMHAKTANVFLLLGLALATSLMVMLNGPAYSCSCAPLPLPEQALVDSNVVFSGVVTEIETRQGRLHVTFVSDQIWKGELGHTVVVQTPISTAVCGYMFEIGQSYLVYGQERGNNLLTTQCSRTRLLSQAHDDLSVLK